MKIFKKRDSGFAGSIMGIDGDYAEAIFRLDNDEVVVIGRDPKTSHIVMGENCSRISRTHCSICVNSDVGIVESHLDRFWENESLNDFCRYSTLFCFLDPINYSLVFIDVFLTDV